MIQLIIIILFVACFLFIIGIDVLDKKFVEKNKLKLLDADDEYKRYCNELSKQVDDLYLCSQSGFEEKSKYGSTIRFVAAITQDDELRCDLSRVFSRKFFNF